MEEELDFQCGGGGSGGGSGRGQMKVREAAQMEDGFRRSSVIISRLVEGSEGSEGLLH